MNTSTLTTPTVTIPVAEAIAAFGSVLPHTSKDDMTPIIMGGMITRDEAGNAYVVATDRYTIGAYELDGSLLELPDAGMIIGRDVIEYISKITGTSLRYGKAMMGDYRVRITNEDGDINEIASTLVEILCGEKVEKSQRFDLLKGNFPPVIRLLSVTGTLGSTLYNLAPNHLAKMIASFKFAGVPGDQMLWEFFTGDGGKPAPVRVTIGKFRGLIQPSLINR